jgi:CDP-glycerol glycerophosphotransferase (TagB/SpsB family)
MIDKTVLFVVENSFVRRSLLESDFLQHLKELFKKIVIVVPSHRLDYYRANYEKDNVIVKETREEANSKIKQKFFVLLKYSIPAYEARLSLTRTLFGRYGIRASSWFIYFWPTLASWYLSRYRFWRGFLRKIYSFTSVDAECLHILQDAKPDIVYANYTPIYAYNFNLKLLRAAKKLGITTVGAIESWDNLYSKVFIPEHTDFCTAQSELVKREAMRLGDFRENTIRVVGLPNFDMYAKKELVVPRDDFFRKIGADGRKKLVFFAAGIRRLGINYEHFFDLFNACTQSSFKDTQFYLRPHLKDYFDQELIDKYADNKNLIFEAQYTDNSGKDFRFQEGDNQRLLNLLHHADVVVCNFSTMMIDACVTDTPVVNFVYFANTQPYNRYFRSERWLDKEHLKHIFSGKFSVIAHNDEELISGIRTYIQNPSLHRKERRKTAEEQAGLIGGTSAATLAQTLYNIAKDHGEA